MTRFVSLLLFVFFCVSFNLICQTQSEYGYDPSGNRIIRLVISGMQQSARSEDQSLYYNTVYPNQIVNETNLSLDEEYLENHPSGRVYLFDLSGKIITQKTYEYSTFLITFSTSSLAKGSYIISLISDDGTYKKDWIVVK